MKSKNLLAMMIIMTAGILWANDDKPAGKSGSPVIAKTPSHSTESSAVEESKFPHKVGIAVTATGKGYWIAGSDGEIYSFGDATFFGSLGDQPLNAPIVGITARPQGDGYWLVAADGGIFAFGKAGFHGAMAGKPLSSPIIGMACNADGAGYWLAGRDGGVFAFDVPFHGSLGGQNFTNIVSIIAAPRNQGNDGYWLVSGTGLIFSFNTKTTGGQESRSGVVATSFSSQGNGYWQLTKSGQVLGRGVSPFGQGIGQGFVGLARTLDDQGYWLLKMDGGVSAFGSARHYGSAN